MLQQIDGEVQLRALEAQTAHVDLLAVHVELHVVEVALAEPEMVEALEVEENAVLELPHRLLNHVRGQSPRPQFRNHGRDGGEEAEERQERVGLREVEERELGEEQLAALHRAPHEKGVERGLLVGAQLRSRREERSFDAGEGVVFGLQPPREGLVQEERAVAGVFAAGRRVDFVECVGEGADAERRLKSRDH